MTDTEIQQLGDGIGAIALRAAGIYLRTHNLTADKDALAQCLSSWVRIKLPEAKRDAKEALDCGMTEIATQTFAATIAQAGIEAARECGIPA